MIDNVILVFLDGVGIGQKDTNKNIFFKEKFSFIEDTFHDIPHHDNIPLINNDKYIIGLDAVMGVNGIPQSGTGQTSIFCGVNAQKILGQHFGPFPHSSLNSILEFNNIYKSLIDLGFSSVFVNAYPKAFFKYLREGKRRLTVTTKTYLSAGKKLFKSKELWSGDSLSAEITNIRWKTELNYKIPIISPYLAANRLLKISKKYHLTVFEYFLTDHIGHGRIKPNDSLLLLRDLDLFLFKVIIDLPSNTTLIITSDHGNLEDISVKTHTLNKAFTLIAGKHSKFLFNYLDNISRIKSGIISILK